MSGIHLERVHRLGLRFVGTDLDEARYEMAYQRLVTMTRVW